MSYGISREEEHALPDFKSHEEARTYFKKKYGNNFKLEDSITVGDRKLYFYKLFSVQDIQIFEDGEIHIVH